MDDPNRLYTEIFVSITRRFTDITTFRYLVDAGLPYASAILLQESLEAVHAIFHDPEYEKVFTDQEQARKELGTLGGVNGLGKKITGSQIAKFKRATDAASLIFAHSILDGVAWDCCRLTAIVAPADWEFAVSNKKIPLEKCKGTTYEDIFREELDEYIEVLDRESVVKKMDLLFKLCKPPAGYSPIKDYKYDRDRLVELDTLRHDLVHGSGPTKALPNGDDDIRFLRHTATFLIPLVGDNYDVRVDPLYMAKLFADQST